MRCCRHCGDILRRLEALEAERGIRPSALRPRDREALDRVLPAIIGALGSAWFKSGEAAISAPVRLALGSESATRLGQLLSAALGHAIAGIVVERSNGAGHARLWRLLEVAPQRGAGNTGAAPASSTA